MQELSSYRPHNPGHDYYDKGVYLITLVTRGREPLFGRLNDDIKKPGVVLSALGTIVSEQWSKTPELQKKHGNKVKLLNQVCMPDHWHGVIKVEERMSWSLGDIIQAVKAGCTSRWRKMTGFVESPISAEKIRHMSHENRAEYYARRPREEQPLFDDNYDDTICFPAEVDRARHERHLRAMLHYVDDNPRRAIIRRARPEFMQRCLHVIIDGRDYAAFGNLFLLRWTRKEQVFCHRKARFGQLTKEERLKAGITYEALPEMETSVPYETTEAYRQECEAWRAKIMAGQTVIVTPGISKGEQGMKDECLEKGFPMIHLQKEPIGRYWKPEKKRFEACSRGSLLILAPWEEAYPHPLPKGKGLISERSPFPLGLLPAGEMQGWGEAFIFHNLNRLDEEICLFEGEARIVGE